jgi:hypothetical protein
MVFVPLLLRCGGCYARLVGVALIVFHHIPKTGGMAVLANIARCNPHLTILKRDAPFRFSGKAQYPEDCCDVLHGHFAYEQIPPGAVRFTFARHPIARFSSCFYSLRQVLRAHELHRGMLPPEVTLTFAPGIIKTFRREQVWLMDRIEHFTDEFLRTQGTFGLDLIPEVFTPDYTRDYDFIGITEGMGPSIEKLGRLIKTDASAMTVCNVSNSGMIRYRLPELQEFYGEAIETYRRLCDGQTP